MNLDSWKSKGSFFNFKNHQIFYIDETRNSLHNPKALVLIHGFPTASFDWWKIWDQLRESYRVITLDMTGFGFSDKPVNYEYSIFDQADLFEELLQHLQISKCFLFAHDYGDTVAQELIARHHEKSLILQKKRN